MCGGGSTRGSAMASGPRWSQPTRHDPPGVRANTTDAA